MPHSLASSRSPSRRHVACLRHGITPGRAANDNDDAPESDLLLHAALRHFATHGMSAARAARAHAEAAFFAADRAKYDWWLAICRTLDRRLAASIDHELGGAPDSAR